MLTAAGSATLPIMSLYSAAASTGVLREIGLFNTTTTAVRLFLTRLTTAGTSSTITEARHNPKSQPALCTARSVPSSTPPTLGEDLGYRVELGAAIGAGVIWTFGDSGLVVGDFDAVEDVANGIGVLPVGTGQILQAYMVWDE